MTNVFQLLNETRPAVTGSAPANPSDRDTPKLRLSTTRQIVVSGSTITNDGGITVHCNCAQAAVAAGDIGRAVETARRALSSGLSHPLFFKLRGLGFEQAGQFERAAEDMRAALAITRTTLRR